MDNQWKKQLRHEASMHHMCAENRYMLEDVEDVSDAIELYKKTIDWALEEGYPDLSTLRKYFSDCGVYGVFIDRHFDGELLLDHHCYVFHNCTGTIRTGLNLERKIIPMLYFANGCNMLIKGIQNNAMPVRVPLYIFGDNIVKWENNEDIICKTYKFDVK